ncbi:MAG: AAA family ATPase [Phycisphaerales bacterium]|nr:MAG: AAA family ATPase [Phycisphaerales bacterium]
MLQRIQIRNFRCLREVDVPLRPLTVLIGPNDSGKSAFMEVISQTAVGDIAPTVLDCWRGDKQFRVEVNGQADEGVFRCPYGNPKILPSPNPFLPFAFFVLPSDGVQMASAGYPDTGRAPDIGQEGTMIPALLDHLLRRDRNRFSAVISALQALIPGFEGLEIGTPDASRRQVDLVIEGGLRIPASMASVGVRLMFFFVALAFHPKPPRLILIEEPDNGVHPKRLKDVIGLLREITQGKHGDNAAQVILTTHSPHLLDYVDLEQDQVLVFRRQEDGSRTAEPVDKERLKNFLDEFMLGEVWFNEGEDGLVRRDK